MARSSRLLTSRIVVAITANVVVVIVIIVVVVTLGSVRGNSYVFGLALALVVLRVGRPHSVTSLSESASDWRVRDARTPTSERCRAVGGVALLDVGSRSPCAIATQALGRHLLRNVRAAGRKGSLLSLWRIGVLRDVLWSLVKKILASLILNVVW